MGFVLPERKRPSYWALMRSLRFGMLIPAFVAVIVVQVATAGQNLPATTVAFFALPLSLPGGVWLTRFLLERRTGYAMPWWIAGIGVAASWAATPWAGAWLLREILAGTFGGDGMEFGPAADAQPAPAPLLYQTGLPHTAPALQAATPFVEPLPEPEVLAPLRVVAPAAVAEAVLPAAVEPVVPEPPAEAPVAAAVEAPVEPVVVEAPPLPAPPAPVEAVAAVAFPLPEPPVVAAPPAPAPVAAAFPLPEPPAPVYEAEPEPVAVAAPTEPALAEAPPIVVEHVAPLHALPPLEEDEMPFFLPQSDLEPAAAHDPFATFWLDPEAPSPEGLTPGYLPPLTGMWRTPLGDKL